MMKKLYLVRMNWFGEVHEFWTRADREYEALHNAYTKLAEKVGYSNYHVRNTVKQYTVEEIKE